MADPQIGPGANLRGADLQDQELSGVNLAGANLTGANLCNSDLSGANLAGADLTGASMGEAWMHGANLAGANLTGAYLVGAVFEGANLAGAKVGRWPASGANSEDLFETINLADAITCGVTWMDGSKAQPDTYPY